MARIGLKIRDGRIWTVLLVLLCFAGLAFGQPVPGAAKIATPGGYQALTSKIAQTGSVRLIVKVDTPFHPMARPESPESLRQREHIAQAQDAVLSHLAGFNVISSHKYRYTPYLFMEVDGPALRALLALPRVLDVREDVPEFPTLDVSVPLIGAPSLWNLYGTGQGFDGSGVTVAVLDTGVDKNHPFLAGAVVSEACYSTTDPASSSQSLCPGGVTHSTATGSALPYASGVCPPAVPPALPGTGKCDHGTHVAGIIAGRQSVALSPALPGGVAPGANLIAIQVFSLIGGQVAGFQSDIMKGLERVYALRSLYNISSVNMSLGSSLPCDKLYWSYCDDDPRKPIIDSLRAAGIATVISSGNSGCCGAMSAPACISSAVSVGATDDLDNVASYSNSASFLSLFAPGTNIMSSVPPTVPAGTPAYPYQNMSGTSMAAPHVSGAWALMKQAKPGDTVVQILTAMTSTGPSVTNCDPLVTKNRISVIDAFNTLPSGPSAETTAATGITQSAATLNGRINANNESTTVSFEYGTTTSYEYGSVPAIPSPIIGTALIQVSQPITGLTENTLYHYRVKADNGSVVSYGSDMTFTTVGACASVEDSGFEGGSPSASWTESSTNFGTPLCTLAICGGAGPRTGAWWAWFGGVSGATETASLTQNVTIPSGSAPRLEFYLWNNTSSGNGTDFLKVLVDGSEILSIIEGNTLYSAGYFLTGLDLSAYADGSSHSVSFQSTTTGSSPTDFNVDDVSITCGSGTNLPIVVTEPATLFTATGATMNGTVNANSASTTVSFEYGASTSYGIRVSAVPSPVAGSSVTPVSATLTGLIPGATYHYRAVGSSVTGLAYGGDMTFKWCTPEEIMIDGIPYTDPLIQSAINHVGNSDAVIEVKAGVFPEDLIFGGAGKVTLKGGYDCAFVSNPDFTTITGAGGTSGSVTIEGTGKIILENIVVQ